MKIIDLTNMSHLYKFILVVTLILIVSSCRNNIDNIFITGKIDSLDGVKVGISNEDLSAVYDSALVRDKQLEFQAEVPKAGFYYITFRQKQEDSRELTIGPPRLIYLESHAKYVINVKGKDQVALNNYEINSTSRTQQELESYLRTLNLAKANLEFAREDYAAKADLFLEMGENSNYNKYIDSVLYIENEQRLINENNRRKFISKNPSSLLTPYFISQMTDFFDFYELYEKALNTLDEDIQTTEHTTKAYALLKAAKNLRLGGTLPDIYGTDINGGTLKYDYSLKKYTLINIWASWCVECRYQTPQLKSIYDRYKNDGFDIIAVSVDKDKEWWLRISKYDSIPWHNVSETIRINDSKNVKNFNAKRLPLNYLINNQKKIIARNLDPYELEKILKDSLPADRQR